MSRPYSSFRYLGTRLVIVIMIGALLCLSCGGEKGQEARKDAAGPAASVELREAVNTGVGVQYAELKSNYATLSESDWKAYKGPLFGEKVHWVGWVHKVEGAANNMWLKVDMNPPSNWDVTLQLKAGNVLQLRPGTEITFEGEIDEIRELQEAGVPSVKVWLVNGGLAE